MAVVTRAAIASALATLFEDRIAMQINRAVVAMQLLPVKNGTSHNLSWVPRFGTATPTGAVIADGADVTVFNSDTKVPATLNYGTYHDAFAITGKARASAAITRNPMELEDLYGEELMESVTRLASAIAVGIYDGDGSSDTIHGFLGASGPLAATGTYANVSRVTYPQWAANVLSNGGVPRAITFDLMREMRKDIYVASGKKPDLILCSPLTHMKYAELFGENRRYMQSLNLRGQTITLDGGHQVLEFDGIPVVEDSNCSDGEMLFLNTSDLAIRPLPHAPESAGRQSSMVALHGTPEEQYGAGSARITARIIPLARTGDKDPYELVAYPQLQCLRCNSQGRLTDLETT